ncbi:MAG: hypothetical protein U0Z26_00375 [Anaerolineales bacterium]
MPFNFRRNPLHVKAPKVLILDFRPAGVPQEWRSAASLAEEYIEAMIQATRKTLIFRVVQKLDLPIYPYLINGKNYTDVTWNQAIQNDQSALRDERGNYLLADYQRIIQDYKILTAIQNNVIDEVWMFGGPYFGFYESRMAGKGAFWCNAPGLEQTSRRFVMMGFNYQRGVQEMIHSFGHRAESILAKHYGSQNFQNKLYNQQPTPAPKNEFEQWLIQHGTVHRLPSGPDYSQNEFSWLAALKSQWWPLIIDPNKVA